MDELIAFLRARYDEAEALAKACESPSPWKAAEDESDSWIVTDATGEPLIYDEGTPTLNEAAFIAANDPAHRLADITLKRKIVDMAEAQPGYHLPDGVHDGRDPDERMRDEAMQVVMVEVLHHLAEEFAAHPDYKAKDWGEFVQPQGGEISG